MNHRDNLSLSPDAANEATTAANQTPLRLAGWLIRRAARGAPPELAARLEEEWLADLNARRSALAQIGFALGCSWATQVIAHDALVLGVSARSVLGGHGTLTAFAPSELSPGAGRSTVVMLVLALHVVVIYAFLTQIIHPVRPVAPPPLVDITIPKDPAKPVQQPPGPVVDLTQWNTSIPKELGPIDIYIPPENPPVFGGVSIGTGGEPKHAIVRVLGGPGVGFPNTDVFYPAASRRAEESGAVGVRVCVDERGRLVGDPAIANSSGSARLDGGALALARAGSGHYRSTTEDGKPVSSCYAYRVRFQLR